MSIYPYTSSSLCQNCDSPIIIKQKREKDNRFCCKMCYDQFRRKGKPIKINLTGSHYVCLKCEKIFIPTRNTKGMYCSYACSNGAKAVEHKLICKCCAKNFIIKNIAEIKRGHYKYCSNECRKRKYSINENYFNSINETTCYWIGFIWSSIKSNDYKKIQLVSKKELLERFNNELSSSYPIKKYLNKYRLNITSIHLINNLLMFGDLNNFPDIPEKYNRDFIRGYFDSDNGYHYKDMGKDVIVMHGKKSKLMKSISDCIKSNLIFDKGDWVSISFDKSQIDGYPKLDIKWDKFN